MPKIKRFKNINKRPQSPPTSLAHAPAASPPHAPSPDAPPHAPSPSSPPQAPSPTPPSQQACASNSSSYIHVGRNSRQFWTVQSIDSNGTIKTMKLKVRDVFHLQTGDQVVVEFDDQHVPTGEEQGLLAGFCGNLAGDCSMFPINFERWSNMPKSYLDHCWDNAIKPRFCFKTNENIARRYVLQSIGKKWAANRLRIWNEFYDPTKSRDEIINNIPDGIGRDQWATYVDYRLKPDTQALCQKNAANRKLQKVTHSGGSKSNARRRNELSIIYGHPVGRAHVYLDTHKRKDGSWVNDAAQKEGEQIERELNQNPTANYSISPNDAVGKTLGMEHSGRVRCMGLGVTPTSSFGNTSLRHHGITCSTSSGESSCKRNEDRLGHLESQLNDTLNAFKAYILMKEGSIPNEFASVFNPPPEPTRSPHPDSRHGSHTSEVGRYSSASNQDHTQSPP